MVSWTKRRAGDNSTARRRRFLLPCGRPRFPGDFFFDTSGGSSVGAWSFGYFFSPVITSLRGLQQTTTLAKVQERLGVHPTSLSGLSEAAYVFDATLLHEVLSTLGAHLRPQLPLAEQAALAQLIAVDGSLLPALPRMAWALWQDDQHRAAKMHVAFAVLRQGPVDVTVTAGNGSERAEWRRLVQPGGFYVVDRGYVD